MEVVESDYEKEKSGEVEDEKMCQKENKIKRVKFQMRKSLQIIWAVIVTEILQIGLDKV